jgi:hypothetical protein
MHTIGNLMYRKRTLVVNIGGIGMFVDVINTLAQFMFVW